ncbi:MAG: zeta toxin family protein [Niabella sp.]|nr:zeta toxin family protein [Niabella sp.]
MWKPGLKVQKELNWQASVYVDHVFLSLAEEALNSKKDFAYEGHFSKDESWEIVDRFKRAGYNIHLVFLGLRSPELSSNRVLIRATEGGHHVDELTLRDNFYGNLLQLNMRFKVFDTVLIMDTSEIEHLELAKIEKGIIVYFLPRQNLPDWFIVFLPDITARIPDKR